MTFVNCGAGGWVSVAGLGIGGRGGDGGAVSLGDRWALWGVTPGRRKHVRVGLAAASLPQTPGVTPHSAHPFELFHRGAPRSAQTKTRLNVQFIDLRV